MRLLALSIYLSVYLSIYPCLSPLVVQSFFMTGICWYPWASTRVRTLPGLQKRPGHRGKGGRRRTVAGRDSKRPGRQPSQPHGWGFKQKQWGYTGETKGYNDIMNMDQDPL